MIIEIPDSCDLFPYARAIPVNCMLKLSSTEIANKADGVRITHSNSGGSATEEYRITPMDMRTILLDIPHIPFSERSNIAVEVLSNETVISRFDSEIIGFDETKIPLGTELTSDSIFIRTWPDSPLISVSDFYKDIEFEVPYRDPEAPMKVNEAAELLKLFDRYFRQFESLSVNVGSGFATVRSVVDAMSEKEADPITLGLVFMALSSRMGLRPIMCISGQRCFIGLELSDVSAGYDADLSDKAVMISVSSSFPLPHTESHKYLMMEAGVDIELHESIQMAADHCFGKMDFDGICSYRSCLEKIERIQTFCGKKTRVVSDGE